MSANAMRVPDYCAALTGYRAWTFVEHNDGVWLKGIGDGDGVFWPRFEAAVARCRVETRSTVWNEDGSQIPYPHLGEEGIRPAPVRGCKCGLWAYREAVRQTARSAGYVWGTVALWGRVIEHEDGWRAERAYPKALNAPTAELAEKVERCYGVSCGVVEVPVPEDNDMYRASLRGWGQLWMNTYHQPSTWLSFTPYVPATPAPPWRTAWGEAFLDIDEHQLIRPISRLSPRERAVVEKEGWGEYFPATRKVRAPWETEVSDAR